MSAVRPLTTLVHVRLNTLRVILLIPWVVAAFASFLLNVELKGQCQFGDWSSVSREFCWIFLFFGNDCKTYCGTITEDQMKFEHQEVGTISRSGVYCIIIGKV